MKNKIIVINRKKFVKLFLEQAVPILRKLHKKDSKYSPTTNEQIILTLGQPIAEIDSVFQALYLLSKLFISHSSFYERKGFSRVQQHRKNIEWYLNEAYILKERVIMLLRLIEKCLSAAGYARDNEERRRIKILKKGFLDSINQTILMRGEHTHKFSYQDKDLEHIELLDVSLKEVKFDKKTHNSLKSDMNYLLTNHRKKWKKIITDNIVAFEQLLTLIYSSIIELSLIDKCLKK